MNFSVLMSVYKGDDARYLKRAIESVTVDQSKKPTQLVLVQDGPVSKEIDAVVQNMKDVLAGNGIEFTIIANKKNEGLAAALNIGLRQCKYDYVARMDSDDVSLPKRFEIECEYLLNHPEVSILGGEMTEFEYDENKPVQARIVPQKHDEIVEMLKTRNAINHVTVLFRKNDILELGGYSEDFGKLEDYKLWIDAISSGLKLHNVADVCVNVRIGTGFIERRSDKREIRDWDMLQAYLLKAEMIDKKKAFMNKLYIRVFIYMPGWMKKLAYKVLLRK